MYITRMVARLLQPHDKRQMTPKIQAALPSRHPYMLYCMYTKDIHFAGPEEDLHVICHCYNFQQPNNSRQNGKNSFKPQQHLEAGQRRAHKPSIAHSLQSST